jgi:hypothetical protein
MECSSVVTYRGARAEATSRREETVNCISLVMICWFDEAMIECEDDELIDADKTRGRESLRSNILLLCCYNDSATKSSKAGVLSASLVISRKSSG